MRSMEGQPTYEPSDVAKHNSASDAWIIVNDKVLDITSWLSEHPGGDDVLLDLAGQDATSEFEDVGHSNEARARLDQMLVGVLRSSVTPSPDEDSRSNSSAKRKTLATLSASQAMLYEWINTHLGGLKRVGKLGFLGFASISAIMFLRRYGFRTFSWNQRAHRSRPLTM